MLGHAVRRAGLEERFFVGEGQPISFFTFLKVGVPVTLLSMLLATAYMAARYL
jgi:hypothetical protein